MTCFGKKPQPYSNIVAAFLSELANGFWVYLFPFWVIFGTFEPQDLILPEYQKLKGIPNLVIGGL